jgi:hypothetical protein
MLDSRNLTAPRCVRVEFEAPPHNLDLVPMLETLKRGLKPTLAHITPGTHDIRPHLDPHTDTVEKQHSRANVPRSPVRR